MKFQNDHNQTEEVKKLNELISDSKVAMLTTVDLNGSLQSRPMASLDRRFDGELWFFSRKSSHKTREIQKTHQVNICYSNSEDSAYVSLSGEAEVIDDLKKLIEFWKPELKAYFPMGLEDPDLALLRVKIATAEYWESPSSWMMKIIHFANIGSSDLPFMVGPNGKIAIDQPVGRT